MSDDNYMSADNANSADAFIEGLRIFAKYWDNGTSQKYFMGGEHDVIYIYDSADIDEDSEDGRHLSALGFHYDQCFDGWAWFT